jgi:hypothetical protein
LVVRVWDNVSFVCAAPQFDAQVAMDYPPGARHHCTEAVFLSVASADYREFRVGEHIAVRALLHHGDDSLHFRFC